MSLTNGMPFHSPNTRPTHMLMMPVKKRTGSISTFLLWRSITAKHEKEQAVKKANAIPNLPSALTSARTMVITPKHADAIAIIVTFEIVSLRTNQARRAVMNGAVAMVKVLFATVVFEKAKT